MTVGYKTCSKCHNELPLSDFYKMRKNESVYMSACKICYRFSRGFVTAKPKGVKQSRTRVDVHRAKLSPRYRFLTHQRRAEL